MRSWRAARWPAGSPALPPSAPRVSGSPRPWRPRPARALPPAERRLIEGLRALTPAELTLFALLPDNPSHRHLMQALGIALPTVKTHMSRILQKLALRNRTEAAVVANRLSSLNTAPLCLDARGGPATGP
jgi:DNA-binding NarL/FixJ family response regulator